MSPPDYRALEEMLLNAMGTNLNDDEFDELARAIFEFQYRSNEPYRRYCQYLGDPAVSSWKDIPPIPTDAFKSADIVSFPLSEAQHCFRTSGTTQDERGRHSFLNTRLYDRSILEGWARLDIPHGLTPLVLTPSPKTAPDSSLSHMMGVIAGKDENHFFIIAGWALDTERLVDRLQQASNADAPVLLMGTALAILHFFDQLANSRHPLPEGSQILETGGYKGSGRHLTKPELYARFADIFGLSAGQIINEYSMTELSSQAYCRGLDEPHRLPPWMRFRIIDPSTGKEQPEGELGYLVLYDLANLGSVIAISTQDLAYKQGQMFLLQGRDPNAIVRGCSRAAHAQLSTHS